MKKKLALLAALAMAMSMFAACGDDDSSSSSAPATDDSSSVADDAGDSSSEAEDDASSEDESSEADSEDESSDSEGEGDTADDFVFEGTLYTDGEYPTDWQTPNFVIDNDGNTQAFFDVSYLEPYAETGCQITIEFTLEEKLDNLTLEMVSYPYYLLAPFFYIDSWPKIYPLPTDDTVFISGLPEELDARVSIGGALKEDFTDPYFMQSDGTIVWCEDADGVFPTEPITFTLTAEAIQYLQDNLAVADDGTEYGGLGFQIYGVTVQSVTLSDIAE